MRPSAQLAKARVRWAHGRRHQRQPAREAMGSFVPVAVGLMGIGVVAALLLSTLSVSPPSSGLGGVALDDLDKTGERFLRQHGGELRYLLEDARSGDSTRRRRAMERYDALLKQAPRSVKLMLARRYA